MNAAQTIVLMIGTLLLLSFMPLWERQNNDTGQMVEMNFWDIAQCQFGLHEFDCN